ncbi:hypothetical protein U2F10_25465 [Leptothoe sp. EHU-05/26/07-4]
MKTITWNNQTKKHPAGVCEGATVTWLQEIQKSGISKSNQITAQDCDALQAECEKGDFTWAVDLQSTVKPSSFDALNGNTLKVDGKSKDSIETGVLGHLTKPGDFVYISATNPGGHAMALYRTKDKIYYFDPNHAIYEIDAANKSDLISLTSQINNNSSPWKDVVTRAGKI